MPMSEGKAHGYERTSKHPKNTQYGRQNPIAARWNSEEQLQQWRIAWDAVVNKHLERAGSEERIDHRSHADRGIDEHPTVHEGPAARILEKKGGMSERCELNRQIRQDNQDIRYWKAFIEKQSGKDFNRPVYQSLLQILNPNDVLVIKSFDRLGRCYLESIDQWRMITREKKAVIVVLEVALLDTRISKDLTGVLISDIVLELLSYVTERNGNSFAAGRKRA